MNGGAIRASGEQQHAAGAAQAWQALAMQRAAIDALPEAELRRLLLLIGGMNPEALQRAAATYTETFSAVAEMKGYVAALRPVALAAPCDDGAVPCDGLWDRARG